MENLKELVAIVNRIKIQRIEIIGRGRTGKGQKLKKLYDGIAKGKFKTDEEAAKAIYGESHKKNAYAFLKHKLTEKLLNTLFFINLSDTPVSNFQKSYYQIEKQRAAVKILLGKGVKGIGVELAEKVIKRSLKLELTDINIELGRILRRHFRTYDKKKKKAKLYERIVTEQLEILVAETKVENYYELLIQAVAASRSNLKKVENTARLYAKKTKEVFPKNQSYKLSLVSHLIFILEKEITKDYKGVETCCLRAINYYEDSKKDESIEKIFIFYIKLLSAYIPLKKFEEGKEVTTLILNSIEAGRINWFLALDHYFLLSMHTGNYQKAEEIFEQATTHTRFKSLDKQYKEMWSVYEAYLEFLKQVGILEKKNKVSFRVARFMNRVPHFSKDKTGINISILVIQILLLIAQGKEIKVIDRMEALRTYAYTYLRRDDSLRSNCFIKILVKMVDANFHRAGTIRKAQSLVDTIKKTPISSKGHSQYVEIIPYEHLWEITIGLLHNRAF